ncbi:MAG: leucine-rich repeat domain-containing protein [Oscillibacter sp.]|nr:leucine-rich repeat domain-containing protein [Oscillibacter sp.]
MKLLMRMALLFLTAFVLVTASYAGHSDTDIAYAVTGGNIYFDADSGTVTDCDNWGVTEAVIPLKINGVEVTSIGDFAFYLQTGLIKVKMPDSVTSIGEWAFATCDSLTSIKIGNGVTSIGASAFYACDNLTSMEISASVTSIGNLAFSGCNSLRDIYYGGTKAQWKAIDGISDSNLISDSITIHYAEEFDIKSAPTVGGHAIGKADLSGLTEISVPVSISADTPTQVTLCVPFFDGGKFLGMGFVTATVDKTTQSVTVPVTGNVSGAGKLNVIFLNADFRPLSATGFDIAA